MTSDNRYEEKPGYGSLFVEENENSKHDFSGYLVAKTTIAKGEKIKLYGYKKVASSGKNYLNIMQLDKVKDGGY